MLPLASVASRLSGIESEERLMDEAAIREKVKEVIHNVTNIDPQEIENHASFREDLNIDSLAMLEIGVDINYEFQLNVEKVDEHLADLATVQHVVEFVQGLLKERGSATDVA
jgi:acyl carrier protein